MNPPNATTNNGQLRMTPADDGARKKAMERLSPTTRSVVESAGIVLVPDDGFRDHTGPVFPQRTIELLHYLREHAPEGTDVEIAVEDADYHEVAVHADLVRIATVFVEYVAAPVVMSLIAAYIKDWLGSRFPSAEVRATIIVNRKEGTTEQAMQVNYEGPATTFEKTMEQAITGLNNPTTPGTLPASLHDGKQLGTAPTKKNKRRK